MPVNADKTQSWKADIAASVDLYNQWFITFAPKAYRQTREKVTRQVEAALKSTEYLRDISPVLLREHPEVLPILRMATAPPIARDRLIGLAGVAPTLVQCMEDKRMIPPRMSDGLLEEQLAKIGAMIARLADKDILPWLDTPNKPGKKELYRASTIVADRLCGAVANPIIRNAQEARQLASIRAWLETRGYKLIPTGSHMTIRTLQPGTFCFRLNVAITNESGKSVNVPVDAAIMPKGAAIGSLPLLLEAKSAGDYTNTNKRRKEEATKIAQLRRTYGKKVVFVLFLCGYFDSGYLGYEAAEGIDWVWEHRIDDLAMFGLGHD